MREKVLGLCLTLIISFVSYDAFIRPFYHRVLLLENGVHATGVCSRSESEGDMCYYFYANSIEYVGNYGLEQLPEVYRGDTLSVLYLKEDPSINAIPKSVNTRFVVWLAKFKRK